LIHELVTRGVRPICLSTDYVFEGKRGNYRESDPTLPTTAYGKNKLAIERSLTCLTQDHLIVRVGKVHGTGREDRSMMADIAEVLRRGEEARCAYDQLYSPTAVSDVVTGVVALIAMDARGTFHLSSPEVTSPYELAHKIKRLVPGCTGPINRVSIKEIPLAERRPFNTTLNADKLGALVPMRYQPVEQSLVEIAQRYS
jgi:dTDP-4-dehydrorhamnose reductase